MPPSGVGNRQSYSNQKPEHVLKRVNGNPQQLISNINNIVCNVLLSLELISGAYGRGDKEKKSGLDQLHNLISNSKKHQWQKVHETIMKRHLELCVELKDARTAKDGLHQYRNMVVNVSPFKFSSYMMHSSIQLIIHFFVSTARPKCLGSCYCVFGGSI